MGCFLGLQSWIISLALEWDPLIFAVSHVQYTNDTLILVDPSIDNL